MNYRRNVKVPVEEYEQTLKEHELNGTDDVQRNMPMEIISKMPFDELRKIRKVSMLKIIPNDKLPFNGCKPLFDKERKMVEYLRKENCVYFEINVITESNAQNSTANTETGKKKSQNPATSG